MQTRKHATVIGGSIAGLTAGLALLQRGWSVDIFEATRGELDQRGAGIITHQSLFDALEKLNVSFTNDLGILIQTRKAFQKDGSIGATLELSQIATSWGRMYQLLKQAFPAQHYHQSGKLISFQQQGQRIEASFADGTLQSCDLLIGADGIRSTVRQHLEPGSDPEYAGYVAWRGLIDEKRLTHQEQADLFPYFTFCLPDGEQVLSYPIAGKQHETEPGKRQYNVVWYRPAALDSTLQELLTDIDGVNNGESIAPDKVRKSAIKSMQNDADRLLSPQHARLIRKLKIPFIQPIYDLTCKSMVYQQIAIIGDAAFTARPHLGIGITKAVDDAMALAEALENHPTIADGLRHFNAMRYGASLSLVARSRELGAYLQAQIANANEHRSAQLHRTTKAVLHETANPGYFE